MKLLSFPPCFTWVKFLPSLSLSICVGRHSTALWTRAPHPKAAYLAPTITLSWACTIPKMTSHSEKQVMLTLIFCAAYCLYRDMLPLFCKRKKKKHLCNQKAVFHGVIYLRSTHSTLLSLSPFQLSLSEQC